MFDTLITAEQLKAVEDPLIFDCRFRLTDTEYGRRQFREGHIPGAYYLDEDDDLADLPTAITGRHPLPDPKRFGGLLVAAGAWADRQIVVYDDTGGGQAGRAWWLIHELGCPHVALLDGGIQGWIDSEGPLEAGEVPKLIPERVTVEIPEGKALNIDQIQRALRDESILLVDGRAEERFTGKVEPIDPVAGHVPGAVNFPISDNLANGYLLPQEEIRRRWDKRLAGRKPEEVVHMCGSGVAACFNLFCMEYAGLSGSRLYPGSFSEWIRDPERPIAIGEA